MAGELTQLSTSTEVLRRLSIAAMHSSCKRYVSVDYPRQLCCSIFFLVSLTMVNRSFGTGSKQAAHERPHAFTASQAGGCALFGLRSVGLICEGAHLFCTFQSNPKHVERCSDADGCWNVMRSHIHQMCMQQIDKISNSSVL